MPFLDSPKKIDSNFMKSYNHNTKEKVYKE
jgi:hypothetical protein